MSKVDEFKDFVKTKPSLISYVNSGDMTWQKFYDMWQLYGSNHEEWNKYGNKEQPKKEAATTAAAATGLAEFMTLFKGVDMEGVRKGITGIQKAIGLLQELTGKEPAKGTADIKEPYSPRPMFRRFED